VKVSEMVAATRGWPQGSYSRQPITLVPLMTWRMGF
jgi:hypothetical protein